MPLVKPDLNILLIDSAGKSVGRIAISACNRAHNDAIDEPYRWANQKKARWLNACLSI